MIGLAELQKLLHMDVSVVADAAARMLHLTPAPMELSDRIEAAQPAELAALAQEWRAAVQHFGEHAEQLRTTAGRTFDGWHGDAADAAFDYIGKLQASLHAQGDAMRQLADELQNLSDKLSDAQDAVDDAKVQAGIAIITAALLLVTAVIVATCVPPAEVLTPAITMAGLEVIIALVIAVVIFLVAQNKAVNKVEDAATASLQSLTGMAGAEKLHRIQTPQQPGLEDVTVRYEYRDFFSENMPAELRRN